MIQAAIVFVIYMICLHKAFKRAASKLEEDEI